MTSFDKQEYWKRLSKMIDNAEWHKTQLPNLIATEKAERLA